MTTVDEKSQKNAKDEDASLALSLLNPLLRSTEQYRNLLRAIGNRNARARAQLLSEATPVLASTLMQDIDKPALIIAPRPEEARRLHERLCAWVDHPERVHRFPETETLPFERIVTDIDTIQQRVRALDALLHPSESPPLIVASATSIAQRTLSRDSFEDSARRAAVGDVIDLEDTLDLWRRMGYRFESAVYSPGFASRRGGIIDIFPVGAEWPARIELWGDEIDSIRIFDPSSQRSTEIIESIEIIPAHETLPAMTAREDLDRDMARIDISNCDLEHRERIQEEFSQLLDGHEVDDLNLYAGFFNHGALLDYMPEDSIVIQVRPNDIAAAAWENEERIHDLRQTKQRRGELPMNFPSFHISWNEIEPALSRLGPRLDIIPWGADDLIYSDTYVMPFRSPPSFLGQMDMFVSEVSALLESKRSSIVAITSHSRRLNEILAENEIPNTLSNALASPPEPGAITLVQSSGPNFGDGFELDAPGQSLVVFGDTEIFGVTKQRRTARRARTNWDAFLSEITPGDYVVHVEHGVGRFIGVGRPSESADSSAEYLILEYANRDKLYVPLQHLDRITPYVAPSDSPPHLTRLGTQEWGRAKARAERSTRKMAAELLSLYAAREMVPGHAFGPDSTWQRELEESFPFEETPDQLATLAEVKSDMEKERPMDRLVCGDVGYGKTEIALRAAFKAVENGKQVAVLAPTTVLAQQHYVTFSQRMSAYPIKVEALSRFRTGREQREIIEALANGDVDICIGTHRIIQKDVRFKDIGLVIVDEEQRFGVGHKERLKQMRQEVDVLTLTATPIPRTLHMSLAGVRDMSTIETPPEDRIAIKTYVSEFSDELIREAILREIDRQGQVYFLHNRVYNIGYIANYIRRIVPEAEVGVAHGQMKEGDLEKAMTSFARGDFDVLVCTTIIESGLDIPNVNTLIVNRADTFGLAQLYQLRGRVGRSSRRAYSYLLIPSARVRTLSETAERRLKAMLAATELGAGFRIAMKDLEIRGAGNILGAEQSGHIHAVGFELYTKMLSQAVEDLRARRESGDLVGMTPQAIADIVSEQVDDSVSSALTPEPSVALDIGIPAGLPSDYIPDLSSRMGLYQRLIALKEEQAIGAMQDELRDRFGPIPWQARALLYTVRLKLQAEKAGVESITRDGERIVLRMKDDVGGARRALSRRLPRGVEVGNLQIRLDLSGLKTAWEDYLLDICGKLAEFRLEMNRQVLEVASG